RHITRVARGKRSSAATWCLAASVSSTRGGSLTIWADSGTAAWTLAYDTPPSMAANSSPHRNNHDAAFASRAKAFGSAISPRLNVRSVGLSKSATATTYSLTEEEGRLCGAVDKEADPPRLGFRGQAGRG